MSLKRYLIYSFATLWTMMLIIALVAGIVHQVKFQESKDQILLELQVSNLEVQNQQLINSIHVQKREIFRILSLQYYE